MCSSFILEGRSFRLVLEVIFFAAASSIAGKPLFFGSSCNTIIQIPVKIFLPLFRKARYNFVI